MNEQGQGTAITCDAAAFHSWLVDRRSVVVGRPGSEQECPLACFLSEVAGQPYEVTSEWYYPVGMPTWAELLPLWAAGFMRSLDFTFPLDLITGEQALMLFDFAGVHAEYCWMHTPGGWICAQCLRQFLRAKQVLPETIEGGLHV